MDLIQTKFARKLWMWKNERVATSDYNFQTTSSTVLRIVKGDTKVVTVRTWRQISIASVSKFGLLFVVVH